MAFPAFFTVKGSRQGQFKGEAKEVRHVGWMTVVSFAMELQSPRDAATGQATGRRIWKPIKVVKEWDAASPQGLTACATNELLTEVIFEFNRTSENGEEYVFQTVKLTDATISDILRFTGEPGGKPTSWEHSEELEEWSFTFRKIEITDVDGATMFTDDWARGT